MPLHHHSPSPVAVAATEPDGDPSQEAPLASCSVRSQDVQDDILALAGMPLPPQWVQEAHAWRANFRFGRTEESDSITLQDDGWGE